MDISAEITGILLVDDPSSNGSLLSTSLSDCGYRVTSCNEPSFDLSHLRTEPPNIILVDLHPPFAEAQQKLYCIREFCSAPVLGMASPDIVLESNECARFVDRLIFKPFDMVQLRAMIEVSMLRKRAQQQTLNAWPFFDRRNRSQTQRRKADEQLVDPKTRLSINTDARDVSLDGSPLKLSPKEFSLFELLASRPGGVISEDEIMNALWPRCSSISDAEIRQYIYRLRRKIDQNSLAPECIQTVKGRGYRLIVQATVSACQMGHESHNM